MHIRGFLVRLLAFVVAVSGASLWAATPAHAAPVPVTGVVVDSVTGDGLVDSYVEAYGPDFDDAFTVAEGAYSLDLEPGVYDLYAYADGYEDGYLEVEVTSGTTALPDLELVPLPDPVTVTGSVVDADGGAAVEGAYVYADGDSYDEDYSASDGSYSLDLAPGFYDVYVEADGYQDGYLEVEVTEDTTTLPDVELTALPDPITVTGSVVDADSGEGIAGALVEAYGEAYGEAETLGDGTFSIDLQPGYTEFYISAEGYEGGYADADIAEDATTLPPFELTALPDPVTVSGSVVDAETGDGIAGAYLEAYGLDYADGVTDGDGTFSLDLYPGDTEFYVSAEDYFDGYFEVEITEDTTTLDPFELEKPVEGINVAVLDDPFGQPVADALVSVEDEGGAVTTSPTGEDGMVAFGDLAEGTYLVDVTAPNGYDDSGVEPVEVFYSGGFEYVDFSLPVDFRCEPDAANPSLTNMGFESGLDGWTLGYQTEGTEVTGGDAFTDPWEGAAMARMGSSQPSSGQSQPEGPNIMCQDFVATQDEEKFAFNFFTYDYTGFDEFTFDLVVTNPDTGETLAAFQQGAFGEGTALKTSGWRGVQLDTSDNIGDTLRLSFRVGGTQDDLYAFWGYLDSADTLPPTVQTTPTQVETTSGSVTTDPTTGLLTVAMPYSNPSDLTVTVPAACGDPEVSPTSVSLVLNGNVFEAVEGPPGKYTATVPAGSIQNGPLNVQVICDGETTIVTPLGEIVLYDPSGIITDADSGEPVVGAEVHLYKVPSWSPQVGDPPYAADTCETNETKEPGSDWDQPAPTDVGELVNAASPGISPNVNPFVTNDVGYYGWDVAEGCYYVQVSAEGYQLLVSPVVGVPSEVTDLDLELQPIPVDTTPPDTVITGGPAAGSTIATTSAAFTFVGDPVEDTDSFECKLDGGAFTVCGSPRALSGLSEGEHTFSVRAIDAVGNVDASPASRTFTVDTTAPDTTITGGPAEGSTIASGSASFTFVGDPVADTASFECKLDDAAFAVCTSPADLSGLVDGAHTFSVRAIDAVGNVDASPASRTFTVDTTAPDTTITGGPAEGATIGSGSASFTFVGDPVADTASFECKLDGGAFAACTSPANLTALADGAHTFSVRAIDAAGNVDATPATRAFTVSTGPSAECVAAQADLAKAESALKKASAKAKKAKAALKKAKKADAPKKKIKKLAAKAKKAKQKAKAAKSARNKAQSEVNKLC